jgi:chromosome segregation protein
VQAGKETRVGLIARPRQIRELSGKVGEITGRVVQAEGEINAHSQEIDRLKAELQAVSEQRREVNQRLAQLNREAQQASLALEQARQKRVWQSGQIDLLHEQIKQAEEEQGTTADELSKNAGQIGALELQIRELQRTLDELPVAELQQQVVHWNTQTAVTARSAENAERRVKEFQQSVHANLEQQQIIQKRISQIRTAMAELETERASLRESEASLNQAISELRVKIDPTEQELADLDKHYERIQMDYSAAQVGVTAAERNHAQAQLELTRGKETLESLRRRIEDDFGLVQFEYQSDIAGPTPLPLEGMVEQLPAVTEIPPELEESINRARGQLRRMGAINPEAQSEYRSVKERRDFLVSQVADLHKADEDLRRVIAELDELMKREFRKTFEAVAVEFREMFTRLFGGGHARLILEDEDDPAQTGIDIEARLPGRREQGLSLLSGGERSLTAVALIFSLLKVSPTPFCVLDEVDAMLDEANVGRFCELLVELSQNTQFIVITHNRNTVQVADVIYGVTMGKDSASQVISLRLDEVGEELVRS